MAPKMKREWRAYNAEKTLSKKTVNAEKTLSKKTDNANKSDKTDGSTTPNKLPIQ